MTHHRLEPDLAVVSDVLTGARAPVLRLRSGDRLTVRTLDCNGNLDDGRELIPDARGHCLVGPIAVADAAPGQTLAITFENLTPGSRGFTTAGGRDTPMNQRLGTATGEAALLDWEIGDHAAVNQHGIAVDVRPFLGVVGMPPDAEGEHSTIPPRAFGGGNIDCKELVAGSTLYLPVTVAEAYLFVGDGHAAQGDGEVGGTAIETAMTTTLTVDVLDAAPIAGIHAVTPGGLITFGFDADLNAATGDALAAMLDWLEVLTGSPRAAVLALASTCVDLRVTQIANRTWGVHAVLPERIRAQLEAHR